MTSQGSAYGRFRRALETGNATIALAGAADLEHGWLADALELLLLLESEPSGFGRAALRWHGRYCAEIPDVGFEQTRFSPARKLNLFPLMPIRRKWSARPRLPERADRPASPSLFHCPRELVA